MDHKTFFVKLKDTCQKLDRDMEELKDRLRNEHDNQNDEISAKKTREIQDKLDALQAEATNFRDRLRAQNAERRGFIKTVKELVAEGEAQISKKEEYLKQYGYIPMDATNLEVPELEIESAENNTIPDKKIMEFPKTPTLLDYGISSFPSGSELNQNSPATPKLNINFKIQKTKSSEELTPVLDLASLTPIKQEETPPFPDLFHISEKETPPFPDLFHISEKETPPFPDLFHISE